MQQKKNLIFCLILTFLLSWAIGIPLAQAANPADAVNAVNQADPNAPAAPYVSGAATTPTLIVPIGGLTSNEISPATYINTLYRWGIGLAALLALGQLVLGGVLYTLSAGSVASRESATGRIKNAVIGLVLLIAGVTILVTINPQLINLKPLNATSATDAGLKALDEQVKKQAADLQNSRAYDAAAAAAQARADGNPDKNNDCVQNPHSSHVVRGIVSAFFGPFGILYNQLAGDDPLADFTTGLNNAADALNKGTQNNILAANNYEYHCYQDSIIIAMNYARTHLDPNKFALLIDGLKKLPANLEAQQYLEGDPFSRTSIPPTVTRLQLGFSLPDTWGQLLTTIKAAIDSKDVNQTGNLIVANTRGSTESSNTISLALYYAKEHWAAATYQQFVTDLRAIPNFNQFTDIVIP